MFCLTMWTLHLHFLNTLCSVILKPKTKGPHLMILQCDSGHLNGELIACAKYRIMDECIRNRGSQNLPITHILVIIQLPMEARLSSFVGFQGGHWTSVHIDELLSDNDLHGMPIDEMIPHSISEIFCATPKHQVMQHAEPDGSVSTSSEQMKNPVLHVSHWQQYWRLHKCIQAAVSRLQDGKGGRRGLERISILEELLPDETIEIRESYIQSAMYLWQEIHVWC